GGSSCMPPRTSEPESSTPEREIAEARRYEELECFMAHILPPRGHDADEVTNRTGPDALGGQREPAVAPSRGPAAPLSKARPEYPQNTRTHFHPSEASRWMPNRSR